MWDQLVNTFVNIFAIPEAAGKGIAFGATVWTSLTDYRMWRSLGWLLLGIIVAILGLAVWNRRTIYSAVKTSSQAAAQAAV